MHFMETIMKIHSKSFRRGFIGGFGAPVSFFSNSTEPRIHVSHATIDSAWKMVEKSLGDSLEKEMRRGKTLVESGKSPKRAA
jgi:hypothetical protein